MNKRINLPLAVFLSVVLFAWSITIHSSAKDNELITPADSQATIASKLEAITSNLSEAVPLDEQEITSLVEIEISTYIQTEPLADEKNIVPGKKDTWIALHDLEGNHFADLVPLVDEGKGEVGFITMGSIQDGFAKYMLGWDTQLLDAYRTELNANSNLQAVFFPPSEYGLQEKLGTERHILRFNMGDFSLEDITPMIAENASVLSKQYNAIRSSNNANKTRYALNNAKSIISGGELPSTDIVSHAAALEQEDYRLSCEWKDTKSFVPVYEGSTTYYGGDQNWYKSYDEEQAQLTGIYVNRANNGCGPVAAANILCYMARSQSTYKKLYPFTSIQKNTFLTFMVLAYDMISPAIWGESSYTSFASDVKKWANNQGISLKSHSFSSSFSQEYCASLIKEGLANDKPVASGNLKIGYVDPSSGKTMGWHWVTITKYFQSTNGGRWIGVSSWGKRYSLDWDAYWEASCNSLIKGGYVWFD